MTLSAAERRLPGQMPLHAITPVHGEAGLRERLAIEIAGFPAGERAQAGDALALASGLRQREPYVNHLLRVCVRVLSHYRVQDAEVACAALHDAVEDHADGVIKASGFTGNQLDSAQGRFAAVWHTGVSGLGYEDGAGR